MWTEREKRREVTSITLLHPPFTFFDLLPPLLSPSGRLCSWPGFWRTKQWRLKPVTAWATPTHCCRTMKGPLIITSNIWSLLRTSATGTPLKSHLLSASLPNCLWSVNDQLLCVCVCGPWTDHLLKCIGVATRALQTQRSRPSWFSVTHTEDGNILSIVGEKCSCFAACVLLVTRKCWNSSCGCSWDPKKSGVFSKSWLLSHSGTL